MSQVPTGEMLPVDKPAKTASDLIGASRKRQSLGGSTHSTDDDLACAKTENPVNQTPEPLPSRRSSVLPHVEPTHLQDLQNRLEDLSHPSTDFFVLLSTSTVIASLGLFENSAAVIIGAMIIAPLMRPLVGLSLGSLTADGVLLRRSLLTLALGTITGILISYVIAFILRDIEVTPEIVARTHPTLLDLGVAFFAGAAGSYCQTRMKLNDTLAGVAIAVALLPPLCVVGIGLAQHSLEIACGAALLYITNLVGITVAAALVFILLGYTPLYQARRGLAISALVLSLLVIPLAFSMRELILENQLSRQIKLILKTETYTFRNARLRDVEVRRFKQPMDVIATVYGSDQDFSPKQVRQVEAFLVRETRTSLNFHLRIIPFKELTGIEMTPNGAASIQPDPPKGGEPKLHLRQPPDNAGAVTPY